MLLPWWALWWAVLKHSSLKTWSSLSVATLVSMSMSMGMGMGMIFFLHIMAINSVNGVI